MEVLQCVFQEGEFPLGENDVKLGEIGGVPFYMNGDQYEKWKHTDLTIDAVKGIGGMFSLDNGTGRRFLTKSEICLVVDNDEKVIFLLSRCFVTILLALVVAFVKSMNSNIVIFFTAPEASTTNLIAARSSNESTSVTTIKSYGPLTMSILCIFHLQP